jgi:hypothetical protein
MSQKNKARHSSNCQIAAESAAIVTESSKVNVPMQKRKEDAKKTLYINRI